MKALGTLLIVVLLALGVFVATRNRSNTLADDLKVLAGAEAIDLGLYGQNDHAKAEECLFEAYREGEPFWLRHRLQYQNIHGPEKWVVEEGYVLTPDGRFFHLRQKDATFLKSMERARYEWIKVELYERSDGSGKIKCDSSNKIKLGDY